MARPERNNVDYFPFICEEGKKMFYIEETYGNDGFATFVKLLRELAKTNYHYLDLSKNTTLMFISARCKVTKEVLQSIITDLVELGKFDKVLWYENKIIWCQYFIDNIQDAYSKRNNKCITYDGLLTLLIGLGVRKPSKLPSTVPVKPHSIVEYSIEENIIEEYRGCFSDWLEYKKARKETYKSDKSILACYHKLLNLSDNKPEIARLIVDESMANNWAGLFEYKQKNNGKLLPFQQDLSNMDYSQDPRSI